MEEANLKHTPLKDFHISIGAKMVPFGGWYMPVQYTSIMDEHAAVRKSCGIFDISHMGQFLVSGEDAEAFLNYMLANDVKKLGDSQGQYTFLLNDSAGVIDDLILYRENAQKYFAVVNASMIEEDYAWLENHLRANVQLENQSDSWAGMAVQGPLSSTVFAKVFSHVTLPPRNGILRFSASGQELIVCRTGYTGEDGFEFFCPADQGAGWFKVFMDSGAKPCGLGARDSLRLEMGYPLNGNDLSPERTPIEAGLGFFVAPDKDDFIGKEKLVEQKKNSPAHKLVGLQYTEKGAPPRAHYPVESVNGSLLGELTSGILSPSLMTGIGMAYLPSDHSKLGTIVHVDVRGRKFPAQVVKKPFYKPSTSQA